MFSMHSWRSYRAFALLAAGCSHPQKLAVAAEAMSADSQRCSVSEESNRQTALAWDLYAPHRARVTSLLELQHRRVFHPAGVSPLQHVRDHPLPHGRLCLLGAGNTNDVDLRRLLRRFEVIELVDIDGEALARGTTGQLPEAARRRIVMHGGIDLLGLDEDSTDVSASGVLRGMDGEQVVVALARGRVAVSSEIWGCSRLSGRAVNGWQADEEICTDR